MVNIALRGRQNDIVNQVAGIIKTFENFDDIVFTYHSFKVISCLF